MVIRSPSLQQGGRERPADRSPPLHIETIPFALLDEPLEYIFADHFRQRSICSALRRFAEERRASRAEADMATAFLAHDLALHHADEDDDLFPALRRRALPEDDLGVVLARLADDHRRSEPMIDDIIAALSACPAADKVRISAAIADVMLAYAANERQHIAVENGVVLAIARIRLTRSDLKSISRNMKARRGAAH